MEQEKYFEMVENVLQSFPVEYSKNYFTNKENLRIEYKEEGIGSLGAIYDHNENYIHIYKTDSLVHELFHMSFRDKDKVNQRIFENKDIFYDNGIVVKKYHNNKIIRFNKGITEGFAEYLSRKCSKTTGTDLPYYFVDLLISIYGEDILKYPLLNDPIGFLSDKRFYDIINFSKWLDNLDNCINNILITNVYRDNLEEIFKKIDKEEVQKILKNIGDNMLLYKKSITSLFELIMNEYKNCVNPNISKEEIIQRIEKFLIDSNYNIAFGFDNSEYSVIERITELIEGMKKNKKIIKTKKS